MLEEYPEMAPHDEARYDMCKELGCSCWKKPTCNCAAEDHNEQDDDYTDEDKDGCDHYDDEYEDQYGYDDYNNDDAHDGDQLVLILLI